ncbi:hypothetical protein PG985_003482 [Apiospora marii]|uniref:DNA polymerase delta subunit 3 n=1 Tax=Apiospora marii TaxID=335849 RepID=A0ABR1SHY0_9PEZI
MDDYQLFLAQQILTEDKLMTYRLLSRTMKVHVNLAKQMLYEFHKSQNEKNPNSLMATYLVYGTKKSDEQDGDVEMTDSVSDKDETFSETVPTKTLELIREETLQDTLQAYEEVTSIHIYSLAPHPMKDLQFLSDAAQLVVNQTIEEDSSLAGSQTYGTIFNPHARKRERRAGASAPVPPVKTQPKAPVKQETKPTIKEEPKAAAAASTKEAKDSKPAANTASKKMAANAAPALKRQGSSGGIGQMFAKQASKPKKPAAAPKREEVQTPALSDEGEDDSQAMPEPAIQKNEEDGKSRRDRQAALRRMMDESDGEEEEADSKSKPESPAEDPMEEDTAPPEPEAKAAEEEPAEVVASTGDGRRRGRRRVTKKKQIMDDQGYLVTIQEPGWESFSEDEAPAPKPQKAKPATAEKAAPAAKGKKAAPKGQGSIMSFFGKK